MLAIVDYDAGNIRSVEHAVRYLGGTPEITRDTEKIRAAERVILPGVGSFGDAMERLQRYGLEDVLREISRGGTPLLGICLGLQLFYESSEESPGYEGLGFVKGHVLRFPSPAGYKVPQIGWNSLKITGGRLFKGIPDGSYVYFVHSYYGNAEDRSVVTATSKYSAVADASLELGNTFACQFHPEKSGEVGLAILENFLKV